MVLCLDRQQEFGPVFVQHTMKTCMENEITSILEGGEYLHPGRSRLRIRCNNGGKIVTQTVSKPQPTTPKLH